MKKFKKVLSVLTAVAMLVSSGVIVFAEDQIEEAAPVVEETPAVEETVQEEPAAEEPAQVEESVVEETPVQEETPVVEATPVQEEAPAVEETPVQVEEPVVEEAPVQVEEPVVEETPVQGEAPVVEEAPVQEEAPVVDETPVQVEEPVVEETPVQEEPATEPVSDPVPTYNNEETAAEGENNAEETGNGTLTTEPETEEPAEGSTTGDEDVDDDDVVIIDGWGYVDPEIIDEHIPEITAEMKYPEAEELKLNESVSGTVDAENNAVYFIRCGSNKTIVLGLTASDEAIDVTINDEHVTFEKVEGLDSTGFVATYTMNVQASKEYIINLSSSYPVSYTLTAEDANKAEEPAEETAEETVEAAEENNEEETAGETETTETETVNEGNETTGDENNTEVTTEETTEEEQAPDMTGWITVNAEFFEIGATVTLTANSNVELENMVAWQTKVQNETEETEWKTAGYGNTLEVELTEENINNIYRFRMEDGSYSDEFALTVKEEAAEETEETEVTREEPEATEETDEDVVEETGLTEDEQMTALGFTKVIVTAEEGADLYAEENKESEVIGHLDAEAEAWVILNEDQTWGWLYSEDEEDAARFISLEDAKIVVAEEAEGEIEEVEETEKETLTDEEMIALGYTKVIVTAEEGADLYGEADKKSEIIGHLDAEEEAWVLLNEDQTWGRLYSEDEEAAAQFISMEYTEIVKAKEEIEGKIPTDEEMIALGYTKVIVTAEEGADLYADTDKESEVIGHLNAEEEAWVTLNEDQTWGQLYNEDEEAAAQFISMEDAKVDGEETELTDEELIALGYTKVIVTADKGANLYAMADKESEIVGHLDAEAEAWVLLNEEQTWGQIYNTEAEDAPQFISMEDADTAEEIAETEKMTALGYSKVIVIADEGADVYTAADREADVIDHLNAGTTVWALLNEDETWGLLYNETQEAARFICMEDAIIDGAIIPTEQLFEMKDVTIHVVDETGSEESDRKFMAFTSLDQEGFIEFDSEVMVKVQSDMIAEDEVCTYQWFFSSDNGETWMEIADATADTYKYNLTFESWQYQWKVTINILERNV